MRDSFFRHPWFVWALLAGVISFPARLAAEEAPLPRVQTRLVVSGQGFFSVAQKLDDGRTWSEPRQLTEPMTHPADMVLLADGRVLLVTGCRVERFGVRGVLGDADGSFDWQKRFVIAQDSTNTDTGYPSSVALEAGRVLTFDYAVGSKSHPEWGVHCAVADFRVEAAP